MTIKSLVDTCLEAVVNQLSLGAVPDSLRFRAARIVSRHAADGCWKKRWATVLPDGLPIGFGDFDEKTKWTEVPEDDEATLDMMATVCQATSFLVLFPRTPAQEVDRSVAWDACVRHYVKQCGILMRNNGRLCHPCMDRGLEVLRATFGRDVDPWECLAMVSQLWSTKECGMLGI